MTITDALSHNLQMPLRARDAAWTTLLRCNVRDTAWTALRMFNVASILALWILLLVRPQLGLLLFWRVVVPVLPLVFFVAPSFWRNVCPMAMLNQMPRLLNFTRGLNQPKWFQKWSYLLSVSMFLLIVPARKGLFNHNGLATALLILFALAGAFVGGVLLKGKSGWCGTICPIAAVERLYGQTPVIKASHNHCKPCVGCMKSCYDLKFKANAAYKRDADSSDAFSNNLRKFFAGGFPGFIVAFYVLPDPPTISVPAMIFWFALAMVVSYGIFHTLNAFFKDATHKITPLFAVATLNMFYWFNIPVLAGSFSQLTGIEIPAWMMAMTHMALFVSSTLWLLKVFSMRANPQVARQSKVSTEPRQPARRSLPILQQSA